MAPELPPNYYPFSIQEFTQDLSFSNEEELENT
jgi:hypothetical protein